MTQRTIPKSQPAPTELSHVVMRSAHIAECVSFYETVLGMKRMAGDGMSAAAMSQDGEHHRLLMIGTQPGELHDGPGIEHIAFKTRSMGELLGNYQRCKEAGIMPAMSVHHGGTISMYYLDPDGVQIEVFIDTQPTDMSIEMMNSPKFAENPIGVPLNFDDLCERYEAGESLDMLYAQPEMTEDLLDELLEQVIAARSGSPSL
jgi:catechol-2,3-dioxygenase